MGSHQSASALKDEWLTPRWVLNALGQFELDPCAPVVRPWGTAQRHYTIQHDGLRQPWHGRVWLNPPYGRETGKWLSRLAQHGTGTALIFARTETGMWFDHVWPQADAVLFLKGRLHFCHVNGRPAKANAGAPSALIAYGSKDAEILRDSGIAGHFVALGRAA
jgi:hypothetical protein